MFTEPSSFLQSNHLLTSKERGHNLQGKTYTETTPEITTETQSSNAGACDSNINQASGEEIHLKTPYVLPSELTPKLSLDNGLSCESKSFFPLKSSPSIFPQRADLQAMVAMWNELVRKSGAPVELTPERMPVLAKRLVESFGSRLSTWKHYCMQITKSSFLMGQGERGWKVTLDWALEPSNISKVLEGNYGSSSRVTP